MQDVKTPQYVGHICWIIGFGWVAGVFRHFYAAWRRILRWEHAAGRGYRIDSHAGIVHTISNLNADSTEDDADVIHFSRCS